MAQLHVTRVRREFREIVTSEEVRTGGKKGEGDRWEGGGGQMGRGKKPERIRDCCTSKCMLISITVTSVYRG